MAVINIQIHKLRLEVSTSNALVGMMFFVWKVGHVQTEFVQEKGTAFGLWMKAFKLYLY